MFTKIAKFAKKYAFPALLVGVVALCIIFPNKPTETPNNDIVIGASGDDRASWVMFDRFDGYQTKADPQKVTIGANPSGQNTYINDGDRISVRDIGYELFPSGTATTTEYPIQSIYTFRKRDGTNIILRSYDDELEYYYDDVGVWERLNNGYTANQEFGFVDHNTNLDQTSYVYFGNAVENYSRY